MNCVADETRLEANDREPDNDLKREVCSAKTEARLSEPVSVLERPLV